MSTVKGRDYGYRTSIQIPDDVEKLLQRSRASYRKVYGYPLSRSALIIMAVRAHFTRPDWLQAEKGAANGR